MSTWNAVLQATHSALIDELNSLYPDEKLELGLPKRFEGFSLLVPEAKTVLWEVRCADGKGVVGIARTPMQTASEIENVFLGMRRRAIKEFQIRGIDAEFLGPLDRSPPLRMTIWLPILIRQKEKEMTFDLAIGA